MTNKQIEAVVIAELDSLNFEINTATFKVPEDARWSAGKYVIIRSDKMLEALKDAHPFITDDAVRARVGELITKVEG